MHLRDLLHREIAVAAFHSDSFRPVSARIRVVPSRGTGVVVEIFLDWESLLGPCRQHLYMLPGTVVLTERGSLEARDLAVGDVMLPDYAEVRSMRTLFAMADFCRPVCRIPVYVDLAGMYVLADCI